MNKDKKHKMAWEILEELKTHLMDILWTDNKFDYNNEHFMIPWIHEEAEYKIKRLNLSKTGEKYFMRKTEQIVGEYMEEV